MKERKEHWIKSVLKHARNCKGKMTLSVICAIIGVFGGLLPYYGVYRIIFILTEASPEISQVIPWVLVCLGGYITNLLFHSISTVLSHISAYTILNNIRLKIAEKLMGAPLGVVINNKIGRIKNAIVDRVEVLELPIAHMIPEGLSNLLLAVSIFGYLLYIDYRMALAAMVTVPISFVLLGVTLKGYTEKYNQYMKSSDYVNSVIVEYSEGIEVIKMFNQSKESYEKYEGAVKGFKKYILDWHKSVLASLSFTMAFLPSTLLGIVPIGVWMYQAGHLSPAEFALCVILGIGIVPPLLKFRQFINDTKLIQYAVSDTSEFMNVEQLKNTEEKVKIESFDIRLNDVSFSYDDDNEILSNINIDIAENNFAALVGPSGSGKSTIAKLIARFWDVKDGEISVGGIDIKDIPLKQLSENISFVTQDIFLFDCSLMENIRMGNPKASNEEVITAAKMARCHDFISELENGYNTTAGEAGNRLSGGEKQRISIARAILKDAPIVILDEATTYTDPENEWEIQKSVSALSKDKTLVVIAHRLSTITDADKIILIDDGKVSDAASHKELLKSSSLYSKMWDAHISSKNWSPNKKRGEANV